ncbi:HK97-gp10 family putative phage morphogenesis protein [Enterococcus sp. DIV0213h]|uniref:HK97-gp10 family putative phage morphogenesis protein n=1 Tax=Enterococcus sp. DIV0213h TaxID=2774669 RepID=UPI003F23C0A6
MAYIDSSEVTNGIKKVQKTIRKAEKEAITEATKLVANQLEKNTPKSKEGTDHAKNHVVKSGVKDGMAEVGFDKEVAWRIHFIEFGTIKQRPQGFVQKTQTQVEQEVVEIITKALGGAL